MFRDECLHPVSLSLSHYFCCLINELRPHVMSFKSVKSYTSSSNEKKKETLLIVHTDDPLTFIINRQKKKCPKVSKNLKTKYTALLHIGALINCSLRASSQILFYSFNSNCRAMCCLQEKENRRKEKGGGEDMKSFPQGTSTSIFRQDPARMLRFFMEKGWESIKFCEHFMASTPYKGHLWVDDQASLWLPSYHAHLITYWKNSIHHLPSVRTMLLAIPVSQSEQSARNSSDNDIPFCPHRN